MIDRICLQSYLLGFKIWVPCWHGQQNRAFAALMFKINGAGMPQDLVVRVAVTIRTVVVASGHPEMDDSGWCYRAKGGCVIQILHSDKLLTVTG